MWRCTGTLTQVRNAIREVAHEWTSLVHEMALQIHVLQRVVAKKEDPSTHEKFTAVLQRLGTGANCNSNNAPHSQQHQQQTTNSLLSRGLLLELFWHRLADSLQEVATEKVRAHSAASTRAYPYIRRAAVDMLQNLRSWTEAEGGAAQPGGGGALRLLAGEDDGFGDESGGDGAEDAGGACGMFGSLMWSQNDLLGSAFGPASSAFSVSAAQSKRDMASRSSKHRSNNSNTDFDSEERSPVGDGASSASRDPKEHSLVLGLKPMRDKYLVTALARMSAPIAQMFPELEGYTGEFYSGVM